MLITGEILPCSQHVAQLALIAACFTNILIKITSTASAGHDTSCTALCVWRIIVV